MDYKDMLKNFDDQSAFIRVTSPAPVEGAQKAALNRKGNQLFNAGKIEEARRVFMTTGYSDGLSRVGDHYKSKGRVIEALKMYWLAPDRAKSQVIIEQLAGLIKNLLNDNDADVKND